MINKVIEFVFRLLSSNVYAADACSCPSNPPRLCCLVQPGGPLDTVMSYIFPAGVLIAVAMIIVGGYMWMMSGGDPGRKQQAQGTLTWSVIGLIVLFIFYALLQVLVDFLLP